MVFEKSEIKQFNKLSQEITEAGINGVNVIQVGQAIGHCLWIDGQFLNQVVSNTQERKLKVRYTHPVGQELGLAMGKASNFILDGQKVRADIQFIDAAKISPSHGNLVAYISQLAKDAPDMVGMSIVFDLDQVAMNDFVMANLDESGNFKSPDINNINNFPHARLKEIVGVDFVGEGAATADGLFSKIKLNSNNKEQEMIDQLKADFEAFKAEVNGKLEEINKQIEQIKAPKQDVQPVQEQPVVVEQAKVEEVKPNEILAKIQELSKKIDGVKPVSFAKAQPVGISPIAEKKEGKKSVFSIIKEKTVK